MSEPSARENSVKQLSELYNVVTGVALVLAITNIVDPSAAFIPVRTETVLNFLSFLVVIIPFHQGAVRHLYATYVEAGGSSRIKQGALAFDFVILFSEACLFVALAAVLVKTALFAVVLIALLTIDCIWGFLATLAFTGATAQAAERKWSVINLVAAAVLVVLYIFGPALVGGWNDEMKICVLLVCLLRTVADYYSCWDFYYPGWGKG